MKKILLHLLFTVSWFGASAQVNVALHMTQKLGGDPFTFNKATQSSMGYAFKVTRLQYYISEIKLIHDGGLITPVPDLYLLVDPSIDTAFQLGNLPVTSLEKIQFSIGVDQAHNHLDPAGYTNGHPLAPQNPSMHWGWTSGYRFIALEGFAGADSNSMNNNFQIHTIGDGNYRTIILDVSGDIVAENLSIHLQADYEMLLDDINASPGIISHSSSGASQKIAENTRIVFSPLEATGIVEPGVIGSFQIVPNPSRGMRMVQLDLPGSDNLTFSVSDLEGRILYRRQIEHSNTIFSFDTPWQPGMYIATVVRAGKLLALEKLLVD